MFLMVGNRIKYIFWQRCLCFTLPIMDFYGITAAWLPTTKDYKVTDAIDLVLYQQLKEHDDAAK